MRAGSSAMSDELQIKVVTTGDTSGADKVAGAIGKVTKATNDATKSSKEHGEASKELTQDLASLGSRQNATKDVVEGLDGALKGNAASLFGVAKAAKNLWEVLTVSTPMGRMIQLAIIAANALAIFNKKAEENAKAVKEAGDAAGKADPQFAHLSEAVEKIAAAKTDQFKQQLNEIQVAAKAAADETDRILKLQEAISNAKAAAANAAIDADPRATATEKALLKNKVENQKVAEDRARADEKLREEEANARRVMEQKQALATDRESERATLEQNINTGRMAGPNADARVRQLEAEMKELQKKTGGTSPEAMARGDRMAAITKEIEEAKKDGERARSPANTQFLLEQRKLLEDAKRRAQQAKEEAAAAEAAWRPFGSQVVSPKGVEPGVAIARGLEDKKREIEQRERVRDALIADIEGKRDIPQNAAIAANRYFTPRASAYGGSSEIVKPSLSGIDSVAENRDLAGRATQPNSDGRALVEQMKADAEKQARAIRDAIRDSNGTVGDAVVRAIQRTNADIVKRLDTLESQAKSAPRGF
jgi:hypothetical protein